MPVNLEELAIKSIEQYAGINVRLQSIEQALIDQNRKNELRDDKAGAFGDRLSRIDENLSRNVEEKIVIHNRIDDIKSEIEELAESITGHQMGHCESCKNDKVISILRRDLSTVKETDKNLKEVRDMITTPWGLTFLRFITSKIGQMFIAAIFIDIGIDIIMHYEIIKIFWKLITFSN